MRNHLDYLTEVPSITYIDEETGVRMKICKCPNHTDAEHPKGTFLPSTEFNRDTSNQTHGLSCYCSEFNRQDKNRRAKKKREERNKYNII